MEAGSGLNQRGHKLKILAAGAAIRGGDTEGSIRLDGTQLVGLASRRTAELGVAPIISLFQQ